MSADEPTQTTPPVPTPLAVPMPPRAKVRPIVPVAPLAAPVAATDSADWGRASDDGTVEVREGDQWRVVGQYPDGTTEEAIAYFVRKFDDVAFRVGTLEQRLQGGGASASELSTQAEQLTEELTDAAAVGDLESLRTRVAALTEQLTLAREKELEEAKAAQATALAERTAIVERMEALAAQDLGKVHWKQLTAEVAEVFDAWQSHQQTAPRLGKSTSQQLWKRFRDARAVIDKQRRAFFSELDESHKSVREVKARLVARAEALAPRGADAIGAYRDLLDEWKRAGRAGRKADDSLWAKFKAAGDALYAARAEQAAADEAESAPKIAAREALLDEAKAVADEKDLKRARALLTRIQRQWDEQGRIFPRDKERALDDRLRTIEQALKAREEVDWKRNNPETKARAGAMTAQLEEAIEKLEAELAAAQAAGDDKAAAAAAESLEARRSWLAALGG